MQVKFKKVHKDAVLPSYAKEGDAGLDLTAVSCEYNDEFAFYEYDTGIAVEIPEGYYGKIVPRSSISKYEMFLTNHSGVIDSIFRGTIKCRFKLTPITRWSTSVRKYALGDRIAQLIILPYPTIEVVEVDELSSTERGTNGFGSSGR